ncbi:Uncharacterized protein Fot_19486 [Forsythia ovata]|uniref:Uncharacterized protein n=1 Tax=Forsythia ovata TaxID=205694 RepID=A0ABD1VL60_9LAMI
MEKQKKEIEASKKNLEAERLRLVVRRLMADLETSQKAVEDCDRKIRREVEMKKEEIMSSQAEHPSSPTNRVVINELSNRPSVQPTLNEVIGKGKDQKLWGDSLLASLHSFLSRACVSLFKAFNQTWEICLETMTFCQMVAFLENYFAQAFVFLQDQNKECKTLVSRAVKLEEEAEKQNRKIKDSKKNLEADTLRSNVRH